MNNRDTYKIDLEINKEEILKDLKEIKKEFKQTTKEISLDTKKLKLKRKDILIIKVDMFLKDCDKDKAEKRLKKKLHRKVLVLDNSVREIEVVNR
jgi:thiamine monophosphate kinase